MYIHHTTDLSIDNPNAGILLTCILALTTVITSCIGFLQTVDLVTGIVLKIVGICAGLSTITAAYWTVKASKAKLKQ